MEGRQILDAVMAANETVDDLLTNKREDLACKLDMEKAYNHVNWTFVDYMLNKMGFWSKWRKWMKSCITTAFFAVLINGDPSKIFTASRGLRQEDPLSPIIFIIVMESFNGLLVKANEHLLLRGVSIDRGDNSMVVTHLFFADDTLIFCKPDLRNLLHLRCIFLCFQAVSGLKINLNKSELARIGGRSDAGPFTRILGCKEVKFLFKYLGVPFGTKYKDLTTWELIINKFENSLMVGKKVFFSRGGR